MNGHCFKLISIYRRIANVAELGIISPENTKPEKVVFSFNNERANYIIVALITLIIMDGIIK